MCKTYKKLKQKINIYGKNMSIILSNILIKNINYNMLYN